VSISLFKKPGIFFAHFSHDDWQVSSRYHRTNMEKNCANAVCWVTPSELGIPEISAPLITLWAKKGRYFRNTPLPGYYPTQTNFVPKSQLKQRGIRSLTI
jgi:hypothetical protein